MASRSGTTLIWHRDCFEGFRLCIGRREPGWRSINRMLKKEGRGSCYDPLARATRGLRRMRGSRQTVLLARRAPTIKRWSLDARSEEQSAYSFWESRRIRRPSLGSKCVSARWGWAGEKVARSRRPIRPILEETTSESGSLSWENTYVDLGAAVERDGIYLFTCIQRGGWGGLHCAHRTIRMLPPSLLVCPRPEQYPCQA